MQTHTPKANEKQVGGLHYKQEGTIQHWDYAASHNFDYFQGQITKYVTRWKKKNGVQDLEKALHFLEKYIEIERAKAAQGQAVAPGYTQEKINQGYATPRKHPLEGLIRNGTGQERPFGFDATQEICGDEI